MSLEVIDFNKRIFRGYASVEVRDSDGDILPVDDLAKVFPYFLSNGGAITDEHSDRVAGKALSYAITQSGGVPAVYLEGEIYQGTPYYDKVWENIKSGKKKGMSISGFGSEKDETGARRMTDLFSIAVCERPANPGAMITAVALAKAEKEDTDAGIEPAQEKGEDMVEKIKKEELPPVEPAPAPEPVPEGPTLAELAEQVAELKTLVADLASKLAAPAEETPPVVEAKAEEEEKPAEATPDSIKELVGEEVKKAMAEKFGKAETPRAETAEAEEVKKTSKSLVDEALEILAAPRMSAPRLR